MSDNELMKKLSKVVGEKFSTISGVRINYYRHKTDLVGNVYTACLLITEENELLARGVSICSLLDQYDKSKGKKIAFSRAVKAVFGEKNSEEIKPEARDEYYITRKRKVCSKLTKSDIDIIDDQSIAWEYTKDDKYLIYKLSCSYPTFETIKNFKFKSELRPEATVFEKKIIERK